METKNETLDVMNLTLRMQDLASRIGVYRRLQEDCETNATALTVKLDELKKQLKEVEANATANTGSDDILENGAEEKAADEAGVQ